MEMIARPPGALEEHRSVYLCNGCGGEVGYLNPFCNNCNEELLWDEDGPTGSEGDELVLCGGCHREISGSSKFCSYCGAAVLKNGFISADLGRVLPKCPQCGEEIDYGAGYCEACGCKLEWSSGQELLVDLSSFQEREVIPRRNKPRTLTEYKNCTMRFDSLTEKLNPNGRYLHAGGYYNPPSMQYNSFNLYSGGSRE